jgi:nucleoside phosphorylase
MDDLVVFTALAWERRAVTRGSLAFAPDGANSWRGRLADGRACRVVQTGMGQARARRAAASAPPAGCYLIAGCAGALVPGLSPGDLVVATSVVSLGETGAVLERFPAEAGALTPWLTRRGVRVREGGIASSPVVLATPADKTAAAATGALVVDMESAGVAAVAREREIPFAALRVVLDVVGQPLPAPDLLTGEPSTGRLVLALAGRPRVWPALARLAWQTRVAERRLRGFFAALLSDGAAGFVAADHA